MALLVALLIFGTSVWVYADAAGRNWREPNFVRSAFMWFVGCMVLWPVVFPV